MSKKGVVMIALASALILGGCTVAILYNKNDIKDRICDTRERLAQKCDEFCVLKVK